MDCKTLFIDTPSAISTKSLYSSDSYYANPAFGSPETGGYHGYRDYVADQAHIQEKFTEVLSVLEEMLPARGRLLDVGCGPGFLVETAAQRGWEASGVDVNPWAVAYARDQLGVQVTEGTLESAAFASDSVEVITLMDLVEHVSDPDSLLAEVARILRPGGAIAVLTPNAGSPVSRALGRRWPEIQRAPEHLVLYSVDGLSSLLSRHGLRTSSWHSIGKKSSIRTLIADVSPIAPLMGHAVGRALRHRRFLDRTFELNPRTKFCLYATKSTDALPPLRQRTKPRATEMPTPAEAILEDLQQLARAPRLSEWMFDQFRPLVRGNVTEVGPGIGTFSRRILDAGVTELLLLEPEESCAAILEDRFATDPRVELAREPLPAARALSARAGTCDLVVCQNVLEHIEDDGAAIAAMAAALKPGGRLVVLVPAHPRLFGSLDRSYGHHRRYTRARLRRLATDAGLVIIDVRSFNALGIPGWWLASRRGSSGIGRRALAAYELLVALWRPVEDRLQLPVGLSVILDAERTR